MRRGVPPLESAQAPVLEWLTRALETSAGAPVERIDTQGAVVLLAGREAYKVRRAISLPFLDYSTLERRRLATQNEIAVNRLAAPFIYLEAVPITRAGEGFALRGEGEVVEWATRMRRFDENATLDKLAERGELSLDLIVKLAGAIAASHARAPVRPTAPAIRSLEAWIDQNRLAFVDHPDLFSPRRAAELDARARAALAAIRPLLIERGGSGYVRRCHGDLHLRNLVVIGGEPTPFDAIEFDEAIATGDVLYDLAFTLMDLWERGLEAEANTLLNSYLARGDEDHYAGLAALPFFLSLRAAIRAKVEAANSLHFQGPARAGVEFAALRYFDFAGAFLEPAPVRLVAIGGLSGTGKSALARELAPEIGRAPGAVWLSSDIERKRMFGAEATRPLPEAAYAGSTTREVYARVGRKAGLALRAGHSAIVDATYARADDRIAVSEIARVAGAAFDGLWLEAPIDLRAERVTRRRLDPSDADAAVARAQRADPLVEPGWRALDASRTREETLADAKARLGARGASWRAPPPLL